MNHLDDFSEGLLGGKDVFVGITMMQTVCESREEEDEAGAKVLFKLARVGGEEIGGDFVAAGGVDVRVSTYKAESGGARLHVCAILSGNLQDAVGRRDGLVVRSPLEPPNDALVNHGEPRPYHLERIFIGVVIKEFRRGLRNLLGVGDAPKPFARRPSTNMCY